LTRLISECLSGNSQTTFIGCVSPSLNNYEETLSALLFLTAANKIKTSPIKSEEIKHIIKKTTTQVALSNVEEHNEEKNLDNEPTQKTTEDLPTLSVEKDMSKAKKIIDQLRNMIRYLKEEVTKKVLSDCNDRI